MPAGSRPRTSPVTLTPVTPLRPALTPTAVRLKGSTSLAKMRDDTVETTWTTAHALEAPAEPLPSDPQWAGHTVFTDVRERETSASPAALFRVIASLGGETGYYSLPGAWALRGWLMAKFAGLDFVEKVVSPDDPAMACQE